MKQTQSKRELPPSKPRVALSKPLGKPFFRLLAFLVCVAILVAAFAVSGIWSQFRKPVDTFLDRLFHRDRETKQELSPTPEEQESDLTPAPREEDLPNTPEIPENAVPIVAKTIFEPDFSLETNAATVLPQAISNQKPRVLVYCKNPQEAYCAGEQEWTEGDIGESTFSSDSSRTVAKIAKDLSNLLNQNGIRAIYMEPEPGEGVIGSSGRIEKLLEAAMKEFPQMTLAVQIGRDALLDENGNYIKPVTKEQTGAQVLAIVGSEESGLSCPSWKENLALAKCLKAECEKEDSTLFRGVCIKSTPYQQQYAPLSLSLLVGSGANSIGEASFSMETIGNSLVKLLKTA